jgi:disulfide bond formation protein DsbB
MNQILSMETFSIILSLGVLTILADTVAHMIGYAFSPKFRRWILSRDYFNYIKIIGAISITSTLLALTYQLYYNLPVCVLCWWQRIAIFPIDILALVAVYYRCKINHISIAILAGLGSLVSAYHYYYHFRAWVLGQAVSLPCEQGGLLPACIENNGVLTFGFITIPFMALVIQLSILWWCFVAHKVANQK